MRPEVVVDVSVVVAVYNDGLHTPELALRTKAVLASRQLAFELIFVDDGSSDATASILRQLEADDHRIRVFELTRNFGQAAALACGLFAAKGAVVVTLDGDLQNPPEEVPRLLDAIAAGAAVATGRREQRYEGMMRWLGSRVIHRLARLLTGVELEDYGGNFKAYRQDALDATRRVWAPGKPFFPLALWLGFPVAEVTVRHEPRRHGASRYSLVGLLRVNFELITAFTTLPLMLLGIAGVAGLAAGVGALAIWTLASRAGWLVPAVALTLISCSSAFIAAGTLGLYLGRVYELIARGAPGYMIRSGPAAPPLPDEKEPRGEEAPLAIHPLPRIAEP